MRVKEFLLALAFAATPPGAMTPSLKAQPAAPTNSDRLPGDDVPPPLERLLATAGPKGGTPDPLDDTPGPSGELALRAATAAVAACGARGLRIGAAVIDSGGYLRVGVTGDGARPGRIFFATRKALAALAFDMPSSAVQARLRDIPADRAAYKPNMVAVPGAVPLRAGGRLIGAIGASGATGTQDEACAAAGAQAIAARLG